MEFLIKQKGIIINEIVPLPIPEQSKDNTNNTSNNSNYPYSHITDHYKKQLYNQVDTPSFKGQSLLHILCNQNKIDIIKSVVAAGGDPSILISFFLSFL